MNCFTNKPKANLLAMNPNIDYTVLTSLTEIITLASQALNVNMNYIKWITFAEIRTSLVKLIRSTHSLMKHWFLKGLIYILFKNTVSQQS